MDELTREFLLESYENLDRLDQDFVKLETEPGDLELLKSIFRTIHTIKGTCGFLGFGKLESLAHAGENLLSVLREGQLTLNSEITSALLAMVDAVRQMLGSIDTLGNEGERNDAPLIATLTRLIQPPTAAKEEPPPLPEEPVKPAEPAPVGNIGEILIKRGAAKVIDVYDAVQQQNEGDPRPVGEILVEKGAVKPQELLEALNVQQQARASASDSTIRVEVSQLDRLMNRVGELVLLRNQILQYSHSTEDAGLLATSQRLNLITTELQEGVMKTRMQPIGNIWSKFPRTVRDVALTCGKKVRIEMEGKETELDKTIIEAIKDPLTHIVRNSVDHGIESAERRLAAGKPAEGRLLLRAFHEGGQVNIEISDDGGGLDVEKVRRKALEKGAITAEQASRMSEREAANLIFLPGLSTAEKVTNVSGRGVGMDVVRTNIDKIGGTVDVQSRLGAGTTVRMKIPLTLAIIPALIVTNRSDRYAIPQISLLELVRLEGEEAQKRIESVQGAPVYRLRGRLLPLVYLDRELRPGAPPQELGRDAAANIVILQADERHFGLVVDEINDTEEIVVKPLGKHLKGIKTFAGSTIMGDGRVALILDVLGLAQSANVVGESRERPVAGREAGAAAHQGERQTMLLLECGAEGRVAMELSLVARLEEFKPELIETAGARQVVQYRGEIMPLLHLSELLEFPQSKKLAEKSAKTPVVVYSEDGRSVGLVVDRILDIVEESFVQQHPSRREGLFGSAVIQQKVTDLLDVHTLIRTAIPGFFDQSSAGER